MPKLRLTDEEIAERMQAFTDCLEFLMARGDIHEPPTTSDRRAAEQIEEWATTWAEEQLTPQRPTA